MGMKMKNALEDMCMEFRYVWDDVHKIEDWGNRELAKENLWLYIKDFDFEEANKDRSWGFRWYQYVKDEFVQLWNDMSYNQKLMILIEGYDASERAESNAASHAGEDF